MQGITLQANYQGFEREEDYFIFTDECRLQQVVLNYQSNALKFTSAEGIVTINCNLIRDVGENGVIKIAVTDTGLGIKKDDISKLFQLFGFLESSQAVNTKGIGLGLHICKKIAMAFGGNVSVESEYNVGSTFSFWFELAKQKTNQVQNSAVRIMNPNEKQVKVTNKIKIFKVNCPEQEDEALQSNFILST